MSANTERFIKKITVEKKITSLPSKNYTVEDLKKGVINVDSNDEKVFGSLFKTAIDQHTGNGEVSLFWLMGGTSKNSKVLATGDGNNPDLSFNGIPIEVKAYASIDKKFTVGRFTGQTAFREMVSLIFAVSNLMSTGNLKGSQSYIDVLNFNYSDLEKAAENMCILRSLLMNLKRSEKTTFEQLPFLGTILSNINKFDTTAKKNGLSKICGGGPSRPGGEVIAKELSKHLLKNLLSAKPGEGGYFANVIEKGGNYSIEYVKVDLSKIDNLSPTKLSEGFSANQGQLQISLAKLFR
jgi:hypothetical protein